MFGNQKQRKGKQKQNKNNRLKSSSNFSLWAIKGPEFFFIVDGLIPGSMAIII